MAGHPANPDTSGTGATDRAIDPATGTTMYYACPDERERDADRPAQHVRRLVCAYGDALTPSSTTT
jgi:hypothetical protein